MNELILIENRKKRQEHPLWMLICFALFTFWQMGFIYFVGPSLTIDGKTPLPIDMDNATTLIAVCYILSIFWMIFLPRTVVWTQRVVTAIALVTAAGLFFPFSEGVMRFIVYTQIFCCCFMIGFETFIMVNYFSENTNIKHLTAAYGAVLFMIAVLQNEFVPISFSTFRIIMVISLVLLLIFFLRMPVKREAQPRYVKKSDGFTAPKKMLFGSSILVFVAALMGVSGPSVVDEVKNGVFIAYAVDGVISLILFFLYKKFKLHPFRVIPILMGFSCIGFLLMFVATYVPSLAYISCALIGAGLCSCQILPLYGSVLMKSYPSKYISPIIIALALVAVIVQGSMVEMFRTVPDKLYFVYAVIMVILVIVYMQIEPFFLFTLRRHSTDGSAKESKTAANADGLCEADGTETADEEKNDPTAVLSPKEKEVAELICLGYTNKDIAKVLFISEHTVKDHTKKIYPKMGVHSRLELATLIGNFRSDKN